MRLRHGMPGRNLACSGTVVLRRAIKKSCREASNAPHSNSLKESSSAETAEDAEPLDQPRAGARLRTKAASQRIPLSGLRRRAAQLHSSSSSSSNSPTGRIATDPPPLRRTGPWDCHEGLGSVNEDQGRSTRPTARRAQRSRKASVQFLDARSQDLSLIHI